MKNKIIIALICLLVCFGICSLFYIQHKRIQDLTHSLELAVNNNKAYEAENSNLENKVIQFQYTVDQLNASQDSVVQKLNDAKKQLKIKDKQIKELQYIASENRKVDSIFVHDTIFKQGVAIDTTIGDHGSTLRLHAEFPNLISADYSFLNETSVIIHDSRVTVDPPKKCGIGRLFQKKHTIVEINVLQENPYCETKEEKFVKIVK